MRTQSRVAVVAGTLGIALAAKTALFRHLEAAGPLPAVPLAKSLEAFPQVLGPWRGGDLPPADARLLYGDERLSRVYSHGNRKQGVRLWMVYSATGEDRGHHPEVCMRAAGMTENPRGRSVLPAAGHPQPIQQYLFGRPGEGEGLLGFYWHYTLAPPRDETTSPLQRAYQQLPTPPVEPHDRGLYTRRGRARHRGRPRLRAMRGPRHPDFPAAGRCPRQRAAAGVPGQ